MPILALIISMIFEDVKPDINFLTGLVVAIGGLLLILKQCQKLRRSLVVKKNNLTSSFIPEDKNRISKANNELKLKRNTPINNNRNTLDSCMNIKF